MQTIHPVAIKPLGHTPPPVRAAPPSASEKASARDIGPTAHAAPSLGAASPQRQERLESTLAPRLISDAAQRLSQLAPPLSHGVNHYLNQTLAWPMPAQSVAIEVIGRKAFAQLLRQDLQLGRFGAFLYSWVLGSVYSPTLGRIVVTERAAHDWNENRLRHAVAFDIVASAQHRLFGRAHAENAELWRHPHIHKHRILACEGFAALQASSIADALVPDRPSMSLSAHVLSFFAHLFASLAIKGRDLALSRYDDYPAILRHDTGLASRMFNNGVLCDIWGSQTNRYHTVLSLPIERKSLADVQQLWDDAEWLRQRNPNGASCSFEVQARGTTYLTRPG